LLLRDFDLCPDLISKVIAQKLLRNRSKFALYSEVGLEAVLQRHSNEIETLADLSRVSGSKFTFYHFLDFLV